MYDVMSFAYDGGRIRGVKLGVSRAVSCLKTSVAAPEQ